MTNDEARQLFEDSELSYSNITKNDISSLRSFVKEELRIFNNNGFKMNLIPKMRNEYIDGAVNLCEMRVKGNHFNSREAITFNRDGFIGFAGWADSRNVQPFLVAFQKWIKSMNKTK